MTDVRPLLVEHDPLVSHVIVVPSMQRVCSTYPDGIAEGRVAQETPTLLVVEDFNPLTYCELVHVVVSTFVETVNPLVESAPQLTPILPPVVMVNPVTLEVEPEQED